MEIFEGLDSIEPLATCLLTMVSMKLLNWWLSYPKCLELETFIILWLILTKSGLFGAPLIDPVLIYEGTLLEWGLVQNC